MSSIDERVVEMKFDNQAFGAGVSKTLGDLNNLKSSLKLDGAAKGIEEVSTAASRFSLAGMQQSVQGLLGGFSALQVTAITALSNIVNKAVNAGERLAKSFTIDPIKSGLEEYETNLNSIQTILANTGAAGTTLQDVNAALKELNDYSDQTIYNFSEMAKNIGTFTAAGVDLETATGSIKGIANLAALSGSSSEQASGAMYQLSQAIAAGTVSLEDWNSVNAAGMGGTVFQRALAQTAVAMGKLDKGAVTLTGDMQNVTVNGENFRKSISTAGGKTSWLTSDVLTATLEQFTGDLTDAELAAQGFTEEQIRGIQATAATARSSATEVKTVTQLFDALKETAGSGWAQTWQTIIGDFGEAKQLWTGVNNVIGDFIRHSGEARNAMLAQWKAFGGREYLIKGIEFAFRALMDILRPIGQAFRQIFPATTGAQLADITHRFQNFMAQLVPTKETVENIRRTFAGLFAILGIGWEIVKAGARFIGDLLGQFSGGSGGILKFTGNIGDFLVKLHEAVKNGEGLTTFFRGLGKVLSVPIAILKFLSRLLGSIFDGFDSGGASDAVGGLAEKLEPLGNLGRVIGQVWDRFVQILGNVWDTFKEMAGPVGDWFANMGQMILDGIGAIDYDAVIKVVQTGLLAGLVLMFKNLTNVFKNFKLFGGGDDAGGGLVDSIKDSFGQLTDTLKSMQMALKASTLLQIAAAVGILTLSVIGLSKIDSAGLTRALTAMTVMFVQLGASMLAFSKIGTVGNMLKLTLMGAALILLATAIRILTSSVKKLSEMDLGDLARGLLGLNLMLRMLSRTVESMSGNEAKMIRTAAGLVILGFAVRILVNSVKELSTMGWEEMAKGLVGVGALLGALTIFTKFANVDNAGIRQGAGLVLLAVSIKILASAMKDISGLSWEEIAKGLVGTAGGLLVIIGALKLMPKAGVLQAASFLVVAASLNLIGNALKTMGTMSWGDIAKGVVTLTGALGGIAIALKLIPKGAIFSAASILVVAAALQLIVTALQNLAGLSWEELARGLTGLAASLGIIALGMIAMQGALPGAAALVIVSAALLMLLPVLVAFSSMSWEAIAKGLVMLAGTFAIIGLAGLILGPVVIILMGLGVAIGILGIGVMAAGLGVLAFAAALGILAVAGAAGTVALVAMVSSLIGLIPLVAQKIGEGVVAFARVIAVSGPAITGAIVAVLNSFLDAVIKVVPKAARAFLVILNTILAVLVNSVPRLVDAGMKILIGFLDGIGRNIGQVVDKAAAIIVNFLNGISRNLPKIIQAGYNLIISFMNGIGDAARNNSKALSDAAWNMASGIIEGMVTGLTNLGSKILDTLMSIVKGAWHAVLDFLGIESPSKKFQTVGKFVVEGFVKGLDGNKDQVKTAVKDMMSRINEGIVASKDSIKREQDRLKQIWADRAENIHQLELAQIALNKARNREVGSTAKKKSTRDAEIRRETEARNNAIASAEERIRKLTNKWGEYDDKVAKSQRTIANYQGELNRLNAAKTTLSKNLADENKRLQQLAVSQDKLNKKLEDAKKAYDDAKKTRDDYNQSLRDQYGAQEKVSKDTHLTDYTKNLEQQIVDVRNFTIAIQELRRRGLNDEMYKDLLAAGPEAAMGFVQEVLAGGKPAVDQLNTLGKSLDTAAGDLGNSASASLYQAGVNAAAGIVKGLEQQSTNIEKQMDKIAGYMVNAIKNKLGIKSPSQVFAEMGKFAVEGLSQGLETHAATVGRSAESVGQTAIDSMRKTISGLGTAINGDVDMNPVIAPVLDLSNIRRDASQIDSMLGATPLTIDTTGVRDASAGYAATQTALAAGGAASVPAPITFIQNNTSPKALSHVEIYRNTKSQLSVAKGALTK